MITIQTSALELGQSILMINVSTLSIPPSSKFRAHTRVAFLTLLAVNPRSPDCFACIAASLINLQKKPSTSVASSKWPLADHEMRHKKHTPIHKQDIVEIDLAPTVSAAILRLPSFSTEKRVVAPYRNVCVFPNVHARMRLDNLLQRGLGVRLLACHHGG